MRELIINGLKNYFVCIHAVIDKSVTLNPYGAKLMDYGWPKLVIVRTWAPVFAAEKGSKAWPNHCVNLMDETMRPSLPRTGPRESDHAPIFISPKV
jgi:hypothetical protein